MSPARMITLAGGGGGGGGGGGEGICFFVNKSAASTAPCPATAFTSNKCQNSVTNEIKGRCISLSLNKVDMNI